MQCRHHVIIIFLNKNHGNDQRESFILCPQRRFKGWLQIYVIPCKFTNLYKQEQLSPSPAKPFNFYLIYNLNAKSALVKQYFTLYDLQNLNVIFKVYWLTLAIALNSQQRNWPVGINAYCQMEIFTFLHKSTGMMWSFPCKLFHMLTPA